jgi:CheY-like chemotaxis protein
MTTDQAAPLLLYVEDEPLIQDSLVHDLEEAGFAVVAVGGGGEALGVLEAQSEELCGLISDINLGEGPDGWEVARRARELKSGLPVVYVSAASEHEWSSQGVPASVMIAKPCVSAQVVVAVSSLLVVSD